MKISIGFTGTQLGMTNEQKSTLEMYLSKTINSGEYHHGDCIGADEQFHNILEKLGTDNIIIHPPINNSKRAFCKAKNIREQDEYLVRNKNIVNESEILIATPKENDEKLRSGTWSTIRYAIKKSRKVFIIYPDGKMKIGEDKLGNF